MSAWRETFVVMGLIYFCFMMVGAAIVRLPAPGWAPAGYVAPAQPKKLITTRNVFVYQALKTPQFWLIWWVLCLNVTAGIGVLGQASAMSQEMFPGRVTVVAAAGFVGLMSLFNMGGRFFWASMSDFIGRKNTYSVFFVLGIVLYASVPYIAAAGSVALFVLSFCVIISMYGGGFRHRAGLSEGYVRHALCRRHPWLAADRLVGRRRVRTGAGELHPPVPDHHGIPKARCLQHHHVHHGRAAGGWLHLQPVHPRGAMNGTTWRMNWPRIGARRTEGRRYMQARHRNRPHPCT